MNLSSRRFPAVLLALVLAPVLLVVARAGDTIPFRAWFNVTNLVFPHPTIPARLEVRVAGPGEASDLGKSNCETANQQVDLTTGLAVADYTITAANGDRLVVHLEAQTIPDPVSPQTKLTFSGGGKIVSGTGRLAGVTGDVMNTGWSELKNPQTGEGIGYLEIRGELPKALATFVVTNTDDSGPGSLRQAMLDANATPELETIAFNLPGEGPYSIRPPKVLPTISAPLVIDGTTQPGFAGTPIVELDGVTSALANKPLAGLRITSGNSVIRGLVVNRFGSSDFDHAQILISGRGTNVVEGCYLGCAPSGTTDFPLEGDRGFQSGIKLLNSIGNRIGGAHAGARNLISGNTGHGVLIDGGRSNVVIGNFIGTDMTGTAGVPNSSFGVFLTLGTTRNVVGGDELGMGNLISGNSSGVVITASSQNRIVGNVVGPDHSGTSALVPGLNILGSEVKQFVGVDISSGANNNEVARNVLSGNTGCGIAIFNGSKNLVVENLVGVDVSGTNALGNDLAGVCLGAAFAFASSDAVTANVVSNNVVGANGFNGVFLRYAGVRQNTVVGNFIGTDRSGMVNLGHSQYGVAVLEGAQQNVIGDTAAAAGNVIKFNTLGGVLVGTGAGTVASTRNRIRGNFISTNAGLGIELAPDPFGPDGVTLNDLLDPDSGPNARQNHPVLTAAEASGSRLTLRGTLSSNPDTAFDLDFYASAACDPSGHGEGERYLGSANVTTGADGSAAFTAELSASVLAGHVITATATSTVQGNTSEFSACFAVTPGPPALVAARETATGDFLLKWETAEAGWVPEENASLAADAGWKPAVGSATANGSQHTLRIASPTGERYFRLRKP